MFLVKLLNFAIHQNIDNIYVYINRLLTEHEGCTGDYYMANSVLGKSLCSDWFFLGQDFAVRTVSMETVRTAKS